MDVLAFPDSLTYLVRFCVMCPPALQGARYDLTSLHCCSISDVDFHWGSQCCLKHRLTTFSANSPRIQPLDLLFSSHRLSHLNTAIVTGERCQTVALNVVSLFSLLVQSIYSAVTNCLIVFFRNLLCWFFRLSRQFVFSQALRMSKNSKVLNLKDKISGNEVDLSLCNLTEVPVKELVSSLPSVWWNTNLLKHSYWLYGLLCSNTYERYNWFQQAFFTKATVVDLSCNNITSLPVSTNLLLYLNTTFQPIVISEATRTSS